MESQSFPRLIQRASNGIRKLAAGLKFRGESIWPGVQNDLYVAHLSLYAFFRPFIAGKRVLDVASGSGYGAAFLANGARSVLGVDLDARNVRYAQRTFGDTNLRFVCGDAEALLECVPEAGFDTITSSNTLEHLVRPERFLSSARALLSSDGCLLIAVPPIRNDAERAANDAIPYHRSNLFIREWASLFAQTGWTAAPYLHRYRPGEHLLDFTSPFRSTALVDEFEFERTDLDGMTSEPTLSAVFLLQRS